MLKYIKLNGVSFENSALEQVAITPEGQALGGIPGWQMLTDIERTQVPETSNTGEKVSLNRVTGKMMLGQRNGGAEPPLISVSGNDYADVTSGFLYFDPEVKISPAEWTLYSVFVPTAGSVPYNFMWSGVGSSFDPNELSPCVAYSQASGSVFIREWGGDDSFSDVGDSRLTASNALTVDGNTPALVIASFSVERGLTLRVNGVEYRNESDKRPLTAKTDSGDYRCYRNFIGYQGASGMLGTDISKPQNAQRLESLENFLKVKYSIT